jgi:thiol-disulfide isomerase/thioredoxin
MRKWAVVTMAMLTAGGLGCSLATQRGRSERVGKAAAEIEAQYWINTEALTLKGLQGKVAVVEFWVTWCPTCRESIPHLIELHKKYADRGVVIIGLTDESKQKVEAFVKKMKMTYAVGGRSPTGKAYGVTVFPTVFVVDRGGTIAWAGSPMDPGFEKAVEEQAQKVNQEPKKEK